MENLLKNYIQAGLADCGAILEKKGVDGLVGTVFQMKILCTNFVQYFCTWECINLSSYTLTGSVGNERLSSADVVKGDEDHADQVRSGSISFPNVFLWNINLEIKNLLMTIISTGSCQNLCPN